MKNQENQDVNTKNQGKNLMLFKKLPFVQQPSFTYDEIQPKISPVDWSVFTALMRLTIGWNKKEDYISNSLLETKTGLTENTIRSSLKRLQSYRMLEITLILRSGIKHQFIKINENKDQYILPIKQKLINRVNNFFKKSEVKKEVFINNKVVVNNILPQALMPSKELLVTSSVEVIPPQNLSLTTSSVEDTIHINKKNINTYHDHKEKTMNDNEFKNFKSEELTQEQKELKVILEDEFGFYKSTSEKTIRNFSTDFLKDKINFVQDEMKNKNIGNVGAFLNKVLNNPQSFQDHRKQKEVKEVKEIVTVTKPISQTKELEQKIIKFFYNQSLIQSKTSLTALDEALSTLIDFAENQTVINDFRELGITKSDLEMIFKQKQVYPIGFVAKIKGFLASYTLETQEVKIDMNLRQIGLSFFKSATKNAVEVTKNTVEKLNSFGFDDNEPIPC